MDREKAWHLPSTPPSEIAIVDDVEYILTSESREKMYVIARSVDGTNQWRTELSVPAQNVDGTNLVPAGDYLYVSTADGVAEITRQSGEIRRTVPGVFGMVGDNALFTFGGESPLSKFPLDGSTTTPEWQQTPGNGTHKRGAVADGTVYVSSYNSGEEIEDDQIELHAYNEGDGSNQWSKVVSKASDTVVGAIPRDWDSSSSGRDT
ncbi:PQQ-binding-like beta-propeller repeat protein [Haloarculaceae archaeon H-GB2-1]|nr:PQQ-binding-like beta-propeller repeat protein [Haloarculaceae archaeon H-GB2-1]